MALFRAVSFWEFLDEYRLNFIFVKFYLSYSAPATVKFYTLSNFERANKLRPISQKASNFYTKAGKI